MSDQQRACSSQMRGLPPGLLLWYIIYLPSSLSLSSIQLRNHSWTRSSKKRNNIQYMVKGRWSSERGSMFTCWCWEGCGNHAYNCIIPKFSGRSFYIRIDEVVSDLRHTDPELTLNASVRRNHMSKLRSSAKFGFDVCLEKSVNGAYEIRQLCIRALSSCVRKSYEVS